jgi:hypothetical protein
MDMWQSFRLATNAHAPQAAILFDKFHVMRHLGEALDTVRKSEYARLAGRDRRYIKGQKYTLLSCKENLTLDGKRALKTLLAANKRLNTAYVLKESFGQLWSYEREGWARHFFENWRTRASSGSGSRRMRNSPQRSIVIGTALRPTAGPKTRSRSASSKGQQQDPGDPAPRLRLAQRRLPAAQNPHLHAAGPVAVSASAPSS